LRNTRGEHTRRIRKYPLPSSDRPSEQRVVAVGHPGVPAGAPLFREIRVARQLSTHVKPSPWRRRRFQFLVNLYPPLLGAGVRVTRIAEDFHLIEVEMRMWPWNRNYVGTHFGGSLFSMADPFFMVMLIELLGRDYTVWDKAGSIRFRKPGRGTVHAHFAIPPERVAEIRTAADRDGRVEPTFRVDIVDAQGEVVAEVEKLISVRRKRA